MSDAARDLALVLRHDVRGNPTDGYCVLGLWCALPPFPTREAAEARYLEWLRREYGHLLPPAPG